MIWLNNAKTALKHGYRYIMMEYAQMEWKL